MFKHSITKHNEPINIYVTPNQSFDDEDQFFLDDPEPKRPRRNLDGFSSYIWIDPLSPLPLLPSLDENDPPFASGGQGEKQIRLHMTKDLLLNTVKEGALYIEYTQQSHTEQRNDIQDLTVQNVKIQVAATQRKRGAILKERSSNVDFSKTVWRSDLKKSKSSNDARILYKMYISLSQKNHKTALHEQPWNIIYQPSIPSIT